MAEGIGSQICGDLYEFVGIRHNAEERYKPGGTEAEDGMNGNGSLLPLAAALTCVMSMYLLRYPLLALHPTFFGLEFDTT